MVGESGGLEEGHEDGRGVGRDVGRFNGVLVDEGFCDGSELDREEGKEEGCDMGS